MSIIHTNDNNPAGLQLIIANKHSKKNLQVKIVPVNERSLEEPKHLPYLEVDGEVLFSTNSALLYLWPLPNNADKNTAQEWLEWNSTVLAPLLGLVIGSNVKGDHLKHTLMAALKKLDTYLLNKKHLVNDILTVVDIALWCTIYPLQQFGNNESFGDYLVDLKNIPIWFNALRADAIIQESVKEYVLKGCHPSYNSLLSGAKYLLSSSHLEPTQSKGQVQGTVTEEELEAAERAFHEEYDRFPALKQPPKVVLPVPEEKNIFITSALPYVNNVPHLGNIIGCVLSADVFARFSRMCNYNTLFVCGTDEYGTATETKALEEGLTCQQICDKYHKIHRETYEWFNISFDHFGRTSTPQQQELVQSLFLKLNDNGFTFTQSVDQLHCEKCNRYLADRFVEGGCPNVGCTYGDARGDQCDGCGKLVNAVELKNPRCKVCSHTPKLKSSNQFFIDLPKLEPLVHHWMKKSAPGWSHNAQVIGQAWLKEGLKPRCITRDLKWGVPVPMDGFRDKVFYVWFDAPIGYMSISKAYTKEFEKWWIHQDNTKVQLYQFMAKDNVPFHSVLFPAMLLGANKGYVTVSHIMATEYLNYEDGKFSKSRGVGVFGTDVQQTGIPSDVWRFYLLYVRPESQDSSFSWVDLATKNNSELLNNLGNFINRTLVFAKNNFKGIVPQKHLGTEDITLLAECTKEFKCYVAALQKSKLRDGIRHILAISKLGNQYMQGNQPWVLVKGTDEEKLKAGTVINICCNLVALLEMLLRPYMPDTSANLRKQLNSKNVALNPQNIRIIQLTPPGHQLGEPSPLFAKIESTLIDELKAKYAGKQSDRQQSGNVTELESKVQEQADKVRQLKSSGAAKTLWQPEVTILLDLKKKLEEAKKQASAPAPAAPVTSATASDLKKLEDEVSKQGDKVRTLKTSGAEKAVWQPEVTVLLGLKKKLEEVKTFLTKSGGDAPSNVKGSAEDIKRLEDKVAEQALKVRQLKEAKKEKSLWQPEVDVLLKLKAQLAAVSGAPAPAPVKGKKK